MLTGEKDKQKQFVFMASYVSPPKLEYSTDFLHAVATISHCPCCFWDMRLRTCKKPYRFARIQKDVVPRKPDLFQKNTRFVRREI